MWAFEWVCVCSRMCVSCHFISFTLHRSHAVKTTSLCIMQSLAGFSLPPLAPPPAWGFSAHHTKAFTAWLLIPAWPHFPPQCFCILLTLAPSLYYTKDSRCPVQDPEVKAAKYVQSFTDWTVRPKHPAAKCTGSLQLSVASVLAPVDAPISKHVSVHLDARFNWKSINYAVPIILFPEDIKSLPFQFLFISTVFYSNTHEYAFEERRAGDQPQRSQFLWLSILLLSVWLHPLLGQIKALLELRTFTALLFPLCSIVFHRLYPIASVSPKWRLAWQPCSSSLKRIIKKTWGSIKWDAIEAVLCWAAINWQWHFEYTASTPPLVSSVIFWFCIQCCISSTKKHFQLLGPQYPKSRISICAKFIDSLVQLLIVYFCSFDGFVTGSALCDSMFVCWHKTHKHELFPKTKALQTETRIYYLNLTRAI